MKKVLSEINFDANILPFALLFLLITGKHDDEIMDSPERKSTPTGPDKKGKKIRLQTYVRATTSEEFIEVERIENDGQKSYKVEARLEPLVISEPITEQVTMKGVSVNLELSNFTVQGVSTLKVTGTSSKQPATPTEINFDTPENVKLSANYKLKGEINDKTARGEGTIEINIIGASLFGMIDVTDSGSELSIQSLTLSYNFKNLQINYTGLKIEGMKPKEMDKYVNDMVTVYLRDNSKEVSRRLAKDIRNRLNKKLKGVSSVKIMSLLKSV